jgi:hypothetical protein
MIKIIITLNKTLSVQKWKALQQKLVSFGGVSLRVAPSDTLFRRRFARLHREQQDNQTVAEWMPRALGEK